MIALVNTHYHLDHTHGNPGFPVGTKVVSTDRTLEHLRTLDGGWWAESPAKDLFPNYTFTDTWSATYGNKTIRAIHPGHGHTDGDLVLLLVEDRVLVAGDLLWNGYYPNIDLEAGGTAPAGRRPSTPCWRSTSTRSCRATVRSPPAPTSSASAPSWRRSGRRPAAIARRGGSLADARREVDLSSFGLRRLPWFPVLSRSFVIGRAYEEASRGRPAQATP